MRALRLLQSLNFGARKLLPISSVFSSFQQRDKGGFVGCIASKTRSCSSVAEFAAECEDEKLLDDDKLNEQNEALNMALSGVASEFGKDSMLTMQRFNGSRFAPVVPTGSLKLDLALGIGGLPKGRIVEIYGKEASGKTTLGLHIIKEAQKLGGYCAYVNVENALDPSFAESIGVDIDNLLIVRPDSAENLFSITDTLSRSGAIMVIVVDSVAALLPKCELDVPTIGSVPEVQSRLMLQALRKIQFSLLESQTLVVFVNQVRSVPHEDFSLKVEEVTSGGYALKFYAAIRMRLSRTDLLTCDDQVDGISFSVEIMKNKLTTSAKKKVDLELRFERGITCEADVLELACKHGLIDTDGKGCYIGSNIWSTRNMCDLKHVPRVGFAFRLAGIMSTFLFTLIFNDAMPSKHGFCCPLHGSVIQLVALPFRLGAFFPGLIK